MINREGKVDRVNLHMLDIGYAFAFIENRKVFIQESDTRRLYNHNKMWHFLRPTVEETQL